MATIRPSIRLVSLAATTSPRVVTPMATSFSAARSRPFLNMAGLGAFLDSSPVTISVTRKLPYAPSALYRLVSDVDSYSQFVPFCEESKVTKWETLPPPSPTSSADPVRVPVEAYLRVGFFGINETFTSRLRCTPGVAVEALSGEAAIEAGGSSEIRSGPLRSLVTKWTITPVDMQTSGSPTEDADSVALTETSQSIIELQLKYDFRDPAKNIAGRAVSDTVAAKMVEAFEAQARRVIVGEDVPVTKSISSGLPGPIKAFAKSQIQKELRKNQ
ncbi:Coenzyme Q-binding protein coq10, mitochondrial [Ceratocystis pirilliformis]|uniref:Coenzyme Q-binding protein coq10, mitochondrial n=1 Tax=Ceratocystis pirilliformis TaxID=259994 RepID=A0ABR3ZG85_9PEZI